MHVHLMYSVSHTQKAAKALPMREKTVNCKKLAIIQNVDCKLRATDSMHIDFG